jgi:uncharacterized protein (TIGR02996 family)
MSSAKLRQALEQALVEDPDDLAAHSAYADLLMESDDPDDMARGEFISVQLALEDQGRPAKERRPLDAKETRLLKKHERTWLGDLAPVLFEEDVPDYLRHEAKPNRHRWARGWLDDVYLYRLTVARARTLARSGAARLLRRLHVEDSCYEDDFKPEPGEDVPEGSEYPAVFLLQEAPFLSCLQVFQFGETVNLTAESYNCTENASGVAEIVRKMVRLEELSVFAHGTDLETLFGLPALANLRTLLVYHHPERYPLGVLANNPALGQLATLRLRPAHSEPRDGPFLPRDGVSALIHSPHLTSLRHLHLHASGLGNEGCEEIVRSGLLKRLKVLDLRHGCVQDEGALTLAACPDIKNLEFLCLADNELTPVGQAALKRLGIPVECDTQNEPGSDAYLYSGDME